MEVSEFENKRWKEWNQPLEFRHKAALSLITGGTILDLGSGDGLLLGLLHDKGIQATGLDISDEGVKKSIEKGLDAKVHSFDKPLPYADESFDTVLLLDVLEHVYDPLQLLKEAARVSKKAVIVGVPNFSSLPARLQVLRGRVPENNAPNKGHIYWFNHRVLAKLARQANLHIISIKMNTFSPISMVEPGIINLFPNLFALSFIAVLKKE